SWFPTRSRTWPGPCRWFMKEERPAARIPTPRRPLSWTARAACAGSSGRIDSLFGFRRSSCWRLSMRTCRANTDPGNQKILSLDAWPLPSGQPSSGRSAVLPQQVRHLGLIVLNGQVERCAAIIHFRVHVSAVREQELRQLDLAMRCCPVQRGDAALLAGVYVGAVLAEQASDFQLPG